MHIRESLIEIIILLLFCVLAGPDQETSCLVRLARRSERRSHDITLRRAPDKVEREASHQRERRNSCRGQDIDIVRIHNLHLLDRVLLCLATQIEDDEIASMHVLKGTEKAVAVTGDRQITGLANVSGALDPPHSPVKGQFVGTLENRSLEIHTWNAQYCDGRGPFLRQGLSVGNNSFRRPQPKVNARTNRRVNGRRKILSRLASRFRLKPRNRRTGRG